MSHDGLLFGEAAERRGLAQPERLVREFKRRIGDDVPVVVAGQRFAAEDLFARMVAWVVDAVSEREGVQPDAIIATVPVTWGDYRRSLVAAALAREVSCPVELVSEPVAAAWHYESTTPLGAGRVLAVYDLGGGTFDVALVGKDDDGDLRIVGTPTGIGDFGGADFDDLVLGLTFTAAGLSADDLAADADARVALSTLRRECVEAKEALSFDSEAAIPVLIAGAGATVRITRAEFEDLIEPGIQRTIDLLQSTLEANDIGDRLDAILLTGGSSRIPRVAQLLSERFDAPIAVDADPKAVVALGATRVLFDHLNGRGAIAPLAGLGAVALVGVDSPDAAAALTGEVGARALTATESATASDDAAAAVKPKRWFHRLPATAAVAGGALVLASGIVLLSTTNLAPGSRLQNAEPASLSEWLGITFEAGAAAAEPMSSSAQQAPPAITAPIGKGTEPRSARPNPRQAVAERVAPTPTAPPASPTAPKGGTPTPSTGSGTTPAGSGSDTSGSGTGDETTPGGTTTDPVTPNPVEPTTEPEPPAPEPTTEPPAPTPTPTTEPPAPEPTPEPPAPEPTPEPPAPEPEPPAPEPSPEPPAPEPTLEAPAPEPEPSPTSTSIPEIQ
ncbi:Hsp70 family protein [Microbacterium allomyrinae]|uniref:Hsp70 family protein n=1 Tax=Microbacterium allomyrinae TaxID=2830666 RepID=A0A9X1LYK1_9MICO|nr:Hsp70 family protein [Microbacterium allomyrinae]MCC2034101.1 Hsp70 family protein [Microbacterium allomyrinae]